MGVSSQNITHLNQAVSLFCGSSRHSCCHCLSVHQPQIVPLEVSSQVPLVHVACSTIMSIVFAKVTQTLYIIHVIYTCYRQRVGENPVGIRPHGNYFYHFFHFHQLFHMYLHRPKWQLNYL